MGGHIRFKAEVDFDGMEITRAYLYKQDLDLLLKVGAGFVEKDAEFCPQDCQLPLGYLYCGADTCLLKCPLY